MRGKCSGLLESMVDIEDEYGSDGAKQLKPHKLKHECVKMRSRLGFRFDTNGEPSVMVFFFFYALWNSTLFYFVAYVWVVA